MTIPANPQAVPNRSSQSPVYDWVRFWVGRTDTVFLSDGGFLADPTDPFASSLGPVPQPLEKLGTYQALALLGEPGIGKSTALKSEADRTAGVDSLYFDLRDFSSDGLLYQRVFQNPQFLDWKGGASHLTLHFDSLDEGLLRIETIANLLASEFRQCPAERLSVRIACRTAVWPTTLDVACREIWRDGFGAFELAPLRRRDVAAAATAHDIDPEVFINALHDTNAVPFAIKPLTLRMLLDIYREDGSFVRSKTTADEIRAV
jgi:hypothetical protein